MLRSVIKSERFREKYRRRKEDFIRKRKLGFKEIIIYQMVTSSRSLSVSLSKYLEEIGKKEESYTKQAYSKARMKIRHEGYIELNDMLLEAYYKEAHKTYKGYRLLGIDGSQIELPEGNQLSAHFGKINKNEKMCNASWSTIVYDILNKQVIDGRLNKYVEAEGRSVKEQLKKIRLEGKQRQDIIVADRGFPSLELMIELSEMGYEYVMRYAGNGFLRETRELLKSNEDDIDIKILLKAAGKRRENETIRKKLREGIADTLRIRIVRIELSNGEKEYLLTTLLDKDKFSIEDLKEIYGLRWNQEGYYDFQKNVIQIEDFTGKTVESILQDYHSRVLVGNIHSMIVGEAEEKINKEVKENPKLKYKEYKSNRAVTYGLMKERIYRMLDEDNHQWEKEYEELVMLATKYKIPVIKNRSFPRKKKGSPKYPINKKKVI